MDDNWLVLVEYGPDSLVFLYGVRVGMLPASRNGEQDAGEELARTAGHSAPI